jgi:AraC-like DNA-binding protein
MPSKIPAVAGFECSFVSEYEETGDGALLSLRFLKLHEQFEHTSAGPCLLLTLDAGFATIESGDTQLSITPETFASLPAGLPVKITAQSDALKLARLTYGPAFLRDAHRAVGHEACDLEKTFSKPAALRRTTWVNEIWNRYIFERSVVGSSDSLASRFCEIEILREAVLRLKHAGSFDPTCSRQRLGSLSSPVEKAVTHIERNLHDRNLDLDGLATVAGASKSSLQRAFVKQLGESPMRYLWKRRLQAARLLLGTGRYGVAEMAIHIGYADVSSFSQAYLREFGHPPSRAGGA